MIDDPIKDFSGFFEQNGSHATQDAVKSNQRRYMPSGNGAATKAKTVRESDLPPIISAADLLSKAPKEPPQLIHNLIHQGSKMVLAGGSKSFKTWSLLDLALSVSAGVDWWGFKTTKAKVLYVDLELQDWSFAQRVEAIRAAKPEIDRPVDLHVWNLRGHGVSFEELRPKISQAIAQNYGLIILDPIYKVYGDRDENCAGDMGSLLNEFERLAVESGSAVVFGAHFSKGNQAAKESIDRISGSGVFARDPDSILIMTRHECEDTFTVEATLRNLKPIEPFCVERQHPLMVRNEALDPAKLKKPGFTKKYSADQLLEVLGNQSLLTKEWMLQVRHRTNMSERTFMEKLSELKVCGNKIVQDAKKCWSAINSGGGTAEVQ